MWRWVLRRAVAAAALVVCAQAQQPAQCSKPTIPLACSGPKTPQDFVDKMLNRSVYDRTLRPMCADKGPTVVEAQFRLLHLNSVDQKLGIISLSGYLRTWWTDPRIKFPSTAEGGCYDEYTLTSSAAQARLWVPDIYIDNLVTKTVEGFAAKIKVYPDGRVYRAEQVIIAVKTFLNLGKLPYDEHVGKILLASYSQDISRLRVMAKGGTVGEGISGIGLTAPASAMEHNIWAFDGDEEKGFETPGSVEILFGDSWDYLTITFKFKRKPKFMVDQVIVPAILFALVSYIQFWVDPNAAPARATLAVIPVLIMLTLSSAMYRSLPEGSQRMWLSENLMIFTFICILAAMEFGAVQYCMLLEKAATAKRAGLKANEKVASLLLSQANGEGKTLKEMLARYEPKQKEPSNPAEQDQPAASNPNPTRTQSADAKAQNIKECDLLFFHYVADIFKMYDADESGFLHSKEVRNALTYFNIYISVAETPKLICRFLRDHGHSTREEEKAEELTSTQFCRLLIEMDNYSLREGTGWSLRAYFESKPPSNRWDIIARWVLPIVLILQQVILQAMLPNYE